MPDSATSRWPTLAPPRLDGVTPDPAAPRRVRDRVAGQSALLLGVAGALLVCLAWAIASSVFAYPDEGAHVTRAAAFGGGRGVVRKKPVSKEGWPIIRAPNSLAQSIY